MFGPHVRPGYFKPDPPIVTRRGKVRKRFRKSPRDVIRCHGNDLGRYIFHNGEGYVVADVTCPGASRSRRRRRRKGRNKRKTSVGANFGRYRERNPELIKLGTLPNNHPMGTFKMYSNHQVQQSSILKTTGSLPGALVVERCWDQVNPGPPFNDFGPFAKIRTVIQGSSKLPSAKLTTEQFSPGNWWEYEGSFADDGFWGTDSSSNYLSSGVPSIEGFDTLAWDKLKPEVAQAGGAQFITELRDLPRMLATSANLFANSYRSFGGGYSGVVANPRNAADNFLNHEFGWAPFLSDLKKFKNTWDNAHNFVSNIVRDNGKWVRRRRVLQQSTVQSRVQRFYHPGILPFGWQIQALCTQEPVDGIPCFGYMDLVSIVKMKTWAVGSFKYYRPEFDDNDPSFGGVLNTVSRLATIYGVRINPSLVYNVTPWTWAIDWGTRLGDHIERLDAFVTDGIVSRKLFIMQSMERTMHKVCTVFFKNGVRTYTFQRTLETKARKVAASPYGFDRPWQTLSPRQLSILGAIGISRRDSGFTSRGD